MNKELLKSVMALHNDTGISLAEYLRITPQTFYNKVNEINGAEFKQGEIRAIVERYKLTPDEYGAIFFN